MIVIADTTAPSLTHTGVLTLNVNSATVLTSALLQFDDDLSPHGQEAYAITTAPQHGTLLKNGLATSSFTQADIDNGLISYRAGSSAGGDSFKFTVTDSAGNVTTVQLFGIQIIDAPPTITGAVTGQQTTDEATVAPFAGVVIADSDTPSANENVTVALDDPAKGAFSNLGGGVYDASTGVYSVSGTAAAVTAALEGLIFTPAADRVLPGLSETTTFTMTVKAGLATVTNATTTVVATNPDHPPQIVSGGGGDGASVSIPENTIAVTTVVATDPDAGQTLVYSIGGGADKALFQINSSTGALSFIAPPDFEAPADADGDNVYVVDVQVSDGFLTDRQTLSISVTDSPQELNQTGAKLARLTPADIAALADQDIVLIDATDNVLRLTVAQYLALGAVKLTLSDVVTLADTGANLGALSAGDIGALAANGIDAVDAADNVIMLTLAQVRGLNGVALTARDKVTLRDSGANLTTVTVTPIEIAAWGSLGIDGIDASDDLIVLRVLQYQALGSVRLTVADLVILRDSGGALAALTPGELGALAGKGVDRLDAFDDTLVLGVAQFRALGGVQLDPSDLVTLADAGTALAALTALEIGALGGQGVDRLDATDDALTLSVAQFLALGGVQLAPGDVVVLKDTGAALAALPMTDLGVLAGKGIDRLDASDNVLALSVAQYRALGTVVLTAADVVTLLDTGAHLASLTPAEVGALAARGVDRLDASDDVLQLAVAQLLGLGAVQLMPADLVTLKDTGANLANLTAAQIAGLAAKGIDQLDASDNLLALGVAQFNALGSVVLAAADTVVLADTGAHLAALSPAELAGLAGKRVDRLDATDDALVLSLAQLQALGIVALTAADVVTVKDTGAVLAALAATDLAALSARGVDVMDASDNALTLSVAQVQALGKLALTAADIVTLADTGATLAGLSAGIIGALAGKGVDRIDATDDLLTLSVAQYQALGLVTLTRADVVTLVGSRAALGTLSAADVGALAAKGIDKIDATNDVLALTVAQYKALGSVALSASDVVTLADSGVNLAAMSASVVAALAGKGIDRLDATDDALTLTLAQYQALGTVALTAGDSVTLTAGSSALLGLSTAGLAALAGKGIDRIDLTTDVLTLNVTQYLALGPVVCAAADVVTLADTGANLAAIPAASFAALSGHGIDRIDATDNVLTLSPDQVFGLGPVALTAADVVTLADTGAKLAGVSASALADLAARGVDRIDAVDNALALTVAQYQALGTIALTAADVVTLADTGANLAALAPAEITALPGKRIDGLDATDNQLSLSLAQYQALGPLMLAAADVVTLMDTGAALAALSSADMAALAGRGIDCLDSTTDALTLRVAQYFALGPVALAAADLVTLADSGGNLAALSAVDIAVLPSHGIDRIDATDDTLSFSLAQFNALGATALSAGDALTLAGTPNNDTIAFTSQRLTAHYRIDGGLGTDTLTLAGDYAAGIVFEAQTITNVEKILLSGGNSYKLTMADANVGAGQTLIVSGTRLDAADALVFDGSAETNGNFKLAGGTGSNTFIGGNGADVITAGSGAELIRYTAAVQSTSSSYDTVAGFDAAKDKFQVWSGVTGVDPSITTGKLSTATFDADLAATANAAHLLANHAVLFTPDSGTLAAAQFLVVDTNGVAGYQGGSDLLVRLNSSANLGAFGTGNFA